MQEHNEIAENTGKIPPMLPAEPVIAAAPDKKIVPVVFCADKNYGLYLPVAVQSIIENSSENYHYDIIVLDCGISREAVDVLQRQILPLSNFSLHVQNIEAWLEKHKEAFYSKCYFTPAIYGRLLIPEICCGYEKVIYADIDIIFNSDIAKMIEADLGDNYIGGVLDTNMEVAFAVQKKYRGYKENILGLQEELAYINSGVLLFNIKAWQEHELAQKAIQMLANSGELGLPDQDAINSVCAGKIYYFDETWNFPLTAHWYLKEEYFKLREEKHENLARAVDKYFGLLYSDCIVNHYTGSFKPWHGFEIYKAGLWWQYAEKTPLYARYISDLAASSIERGLAAARIDNPAKNITETYKILGIPFFKLKKRSSQIKYIFGGLRIARKVYGRENIYLYILGLKLFSVRRKQI